MTGTLNLLLGGGGVSAYQISRSLRGNYADSTYLTRTPASAGNRKTWTWSAWLKRSEFSNQFYTLFEVYSANNDPSTFNISLIFFLSFEPNLVKCKSYSRIHS